MLKSARFGCISTRTMRHEARQPEAVLWNQQPREQYRVHAFFVAPIRIEYSATGFTVPLKGNTQFRTYETADTDPSRSMLTVRDRVRGTKRPVPSDQWAFGRCPDGKASLTKTNTDICVFEGFQRNLISAA